MVPVTALIIASLETPYEEQLSKMPEYGEYPVGIVQDGHFDFNKSKTYCNLMYCKTFKERQTYFHE